MPPALQTQHRSRITNHSPPRRVSLSAGLNYWSNFIHLMLAFCSGNGCVQTLGEQGKEWKCCRCCSPQATVLYTGKSTRSATSGNKKEKNPSYLIHADEIMSRAASRTLLPEYYLKCMKYVIISLSLLFCFNGLLEKWLDLPLRVGHNKTMAHETFIIVTASVMVSLLAISFCQ